MKTYTVKEIADMLKTNPETVRRWIRDGKLVAVQQSRKTGNVVTEQMLRSFAKSYPKYSWLLQSSSLSTQLSGVLLGIASLAGGAAIGQYAKRKNEEKIGIDAAELSKTLRLEIDRMTLNIREKEETIKRLQMEIDSERSIIEDYKNRIEEIDPQKFK